MKMIIRELELTHFGKFHHKRIPFDQGVNVIYGKNEAGKSTIHAFIRGMLFGIDKQRSKGVQDLYAQYEPWDNQGEFSGVMWFSVNETNYRLERSFLKTNRYMHLYNENTGMEMVPAEEELERLLLGMTESIYNNTVSIGQLKSPTDDGLVLELRSHMANLQSAKTLEIDLEKSKVHLHEELERYDALYLDDVDEQVTKAKSESLFLEQEIETLSSKEQDLQEQLLEKKEEEFNRYSNEKEKQQELEKSILDYNSQLNRLKRELNRWSSDLEKLKRDRYAKKYKDLEAAREPNKESKVSAILKILGLLLFLAGFAIFVLVYMVWERDLPHPLFEYWWALMGLGVVSVIVSLAIAKLHKQRTIIYKLLSDKRNKCEEAEESIEQITKLQQDLILKRSESYPEEYQEIHGEIDMLEKEIMKLSWEQQQKLDEYNASIAVLDSAEEKYDLNNRILVEKQAIVLAIKTLETVAQEIYDSFGDELNKKASEYLAMVTKGKYTQLVIKEDFSIYLHTKDHLIPIYQVSRGTIEQVYLSIRLSASKLFWPQANMPLLLDDTFAYYDDSRVFEALKLLKSLNCQVIIMTCHSREEKMLKKIL